MPGKDIGERGLIEVADILHQDLTDRYGAASRWAVLHGRSLAWARTDLDNIRANEALTERAS